MTLQPEAAIHPLMAAVAACSALTPPPPFAPRRTLASPTPRSAAQASSHPAPPSPPLIPKALIQIEKSRVIACLRAQDGMLAVEAARAALRGGISVVGTVLNAVDARKAVHAGAKFLMSPGTVMEVLLDVRDGEVLYIPGVMTPTEVLCATNAGARIVKVYPVSVLGGEKYISALKKPFPRIAMVASQGITIDSMRRYIEAGATAVVLSDAIFEKEAMRQRNFDEICRLAKLATLQSFEAGK